MNGENIDRALRQVCGTRFKGVFALDELETIFPISGNGFYVFNNQTSDKPGEHWLAISSSRLSVTFFDSYALPPSAYDGLESILRRGSRGKVFTRVRPRLQGLLSTVCGDYCVLFLILLSRQWTVQRFVNRMVKIPGGEIRDHAVRYTVLCLFGTESVGGILADGGTEGWDGTHVYGSGTSESAATIVPSIESSFV